MGRSDNVLPVFGATYFKQTDYESDKHVNKSRAYLNGWLFSEKKPPQLCNVYCVFSQTQRVQATLTPS